MFFSVRDPVGRETPLVVEIPHAGLLVDAESLSTLIAPARAIGLDADLYVDQLYARAPELGATVLVAHASRYVCDLNRSETDVDGLAVQGGTTRSAPHGLVWRTTTENQPSLTAPLTPRELERRLELIYRPYHRTLASLIEAKRARFGHAVLLCAHSMPSLGRLGHSDAGRERADVVPGSRGRTTAAASVIDSPDVLARETGWTVSHDDPYRGGHSTVHYGRPAAGVHAVQVELARRLYMDERTLEKKSNDFEKVQSFCDALVARLGALALG
ncbi:MAG TPA: N-formylglutamate amidohydrolase [Polyangiaceae bacterium]|nr:N-formylglutamate amidohydrolase [Polyangiaceae bacterium]